MTNLNNNEKDFIELSLIGRDNVEIHETETNLEIVTKNKKKNKKKPSYKKMSYWIVAISILPFLATGVFLTALYRVESFVGGRETLDWLSKQEITPQIQETIDGIGLDWLPQFLEIYSNRGLIIATIFTIPVLTISSIVLWTVNKHRDDESVIPEKDTEE